MTCIGEHILAAAERITYGTEVLTGLEDRFALVLAVHSECMWAC